MAHLNPAPVGGWTVNLSSSLTPFASVPESITVAEGKTSGTFTISTVGHSRPLTISIGAHDILSNQSAKITTLTPGLAKTPWPKFHGDVFNRGIQTALGTAKTNWRFKTNGPIYASPAIGSDGTIYIGSTDGYFYAINQDGTLRWSVASAPFYQGCAAISADGTIFALNEYGQLIALNSDGSSRWGLFIDTGGNSSPTIGTDGTIYVASIDKVYAINGDGTIQWTYSDLAFKYTGFNGNPAIGSDGAIYIGAMTDADSLYAINPNGTLRWKYPAGGEIYGSPAIAPDGTIYVAVTGRSYMLAMNPSGSVKWKSVIGESYSCPAIAIDGTIYAAGSNNSLYAMSPGGVLQWINQYAGGNGYSDPTVWPSGGYIFVGSVSGTQYGLGAVDITGGGVYLSSTEGLVYSSAAIGANSTVYYGSLDGYVFPLHSESAPKTLGKMELSSGIRA